MGNSIRNSVVDGNWELRQLETSDFGELHYFDCGNEDLNEFFQKDALEYKQELLVETYCFTLKGIPAALISLRNDSLELDRKVRKKLLPDSMVRYRTLPAVKIARLGVRKDIHRNGIGSTLLNFCKRLFLSENRTGCRMVTVDAYNIPEVLRFYEKNDFRILHEKDANSTTRIMWCDLKPYVEYIENFPSQ